MTATLAHPDKLFIGGEWATPATGARIDIISPSTEEIVGSVAEASQADVDRAVAAARHAFDHGPWPRMSGPERAAKLREIADRLAARASDFARAWSLQVGIPFAQIEPMAAYFRGYFDYFAGLADQGFEEIRTPAQGGSCVVVREPVGVTAAIVPWNAPLATMLLKVAPALAAGCTVIAKPSPETPLKSACPKGFSRSSPRIARFPTISSATRMSTRSASPDRRRPACISPRSAAAGWRATPWNWAGSQPPSSWTTQKSKP
jgi:acyl-CoA reductase-like NAD-dependent aldehyde dehydrogenase